MYWEQGKDPQQLAADRLSVMSVCGNAVLAAFKFFAGTAGGSQAMVADAAHSLTDLVSTGIAWLGVRAGRRPADADHPYGHERLECVAALILSVVLAAAGAGIAWPALTRLLAGQVAGQPGAIALAAAGASVLVKEWMFRVTKREARKMGSPAFLADAWHHRSDAFSSVGALIGVGGSMLGISVLDSIAGLVICGFVLKAAWDVAADALRRMLDVSCGEAYEARLAAHVGAQPGVERIDLLRTRLFGCRVCVELEIGIAEVCSFAAAHAIQEQVHGSVEAAFPDVKHVCVHANPVPDTISSGGCADGTLNSGPC